jgi:hypothetical protein
MIVLKPVSGLRERGMTGIRVLASIGLDSGSTAENKRVNFPSTGLPWKRLCLLPLLK